MVPSILIVTVCPVSSDCGASVQVPETGNVEESLAILIHVLLAGLETTIDGSVLSTVKVELGPFAMSGFPARSFQVMIPAVILAVPFPVHPVMVTVATAPETVVDLVHPVLVPLTVIPALTVVFKMVPRFVSEKVRV